MKCFKSHDVSAYGSAHAVFHFFFSNEYILSNHTLACQKLRFRVFKRDKEIKMREIPDRNTLLVGFGGVYFIMNTSVSGAILTQETQIPFEISKEQLKMYFGYAQSSVEGDGVFRLHDEGLVAYEVFQIP